jgi:hypothetical protein
MSCGRWALGGHGISCDLEDGHEGLHFDGEEQESFELAEPGTIGAQWNPAPSDASETSGDRT